MKQESPCFSHGECQFKRKEYQMKKVYFVDLENVAHHFLTMAERLTREDQIIIFMRHRQRGLPDMRSSLEKAISKFKDCNITYKIVDMISDEKNAMDFQICTTLGYMVGQYGATAEYYIISNDKGYYSARECVQKSLCKKAKVNFIKDFSNVTENMDIKDELKELLPSIPKKVINRAAESSSETAIIPEGYAVDGYDHEVVQTIPKMGKAAAEQIKKAVQMDNKKITEENLNFEEAMDIYGSVKDEFGLDDLAFTSDMFQEDDSIPQEPALMDERQIPVTTRQSTADRYVQSKAVEPIKEPVKEANKGEDEDLGYIPGAYSYNIKTKMLVRAHILCDVIDPDEVIRTLIRKPMIAMMDAIIEKWHTYPQCEENYKSYDEVDPKSQKFITLKACAEFINGCAVEPVIRYMVEGAA